MSLRSQQPASNTIHLWLAAKKKAKIMACLLSCSVSSWLAPLPCSLVRCLSWLKWSDFPTFKKVNVFLSFFCPHQHSSLSRLCCLVSSHSLGLNSEAAQGALQSEHEYLVGGHHAPCVLFMRPEWRGWQCNIFETLINQAGQLTHD